MPKENDLEGRQDQGGKHGGQKGMPRPETWPAPNTEIPGRRQAGREPDVPARERGLCGGRGGER